MKSLQEMLDAQNTPEKIAAAEKRRKEYIEYRLKRFAEVKAMGGIVLSVGSTRCLDCGKIESMQRLGCSCFDMSRMSDKEYMASVKGVEHGSFIVESLDEGSNQSIGAFISHHELYKRLSTGERFFSGVSEKDHEITLDMFESEE